MAEFDSLKHIFSL